MTTSEHPAFPFYTHNELDAELECAVFRKENPVPKVRLVTGGEIYLATRYEDVKKVFVDRAFSRGEAGKPGLPSMLPGRRMPHVLGLDPPDHTRVRKLVMHAFTMRASERLRGHIEGIVDDLINDMSSQGPPVDFVTSFAMRLPAKVMSDVLGVPADDQDKLWGWMDSMLSVTGRTPEQLKAAADGLFGYLGTLIASKRADPADDLVTRLIEATDDGERLTEEELLVNSFLLVAGGYETTGGLLTNSILTLNRHRDQVDLLREKPELIPGAVEELLRYVRISHATAERVVMEDVELSGVRVAAGSVVVPMHYSANRDPACAEDPDRFDITRPPTQHLAFGHGIHHCIGAPLARLELQIALGKLLQRLPELRPDVSDSEVEWKAGLLTRGPVSLPVTW